ncbi:MAG: hypothetical protein KC501_19200, partial [Myxococcales bacterium]|nr:hypothetical protein [Myxococcales bacterium]
MRRLRWVERVPSRLLLVLLAGCRPVEGAGGARSGGPEPVASSEDEGIPSLEEIADAIDPGPRAALTVGLPSWLAAGLAVPRGGDPAALLAEARRRYEGWQARSQQGGDAAQLEGLVELARALALAERAAGDLQHAPVEALVLLERVYDLLDVPALANDRNLFSQMIQGFVQIIAEGGDASSSAMLDDLAKLVFEGVQRADELHRRTVAALLRDAPEHPSIPDVLSRTAESVHAQDEALAVGIMRRSLAMRGEAATAAHWLDLASLCYRSLELRCGNEARARAEALAPADDEKLAERLHRSLEQAKHANAVVELQDAAGLEDRLDQARALMELQRNADAREIYEQLHRLHPEDARPVAGLARVMLLERLDFVAAFEIIDRARPREHLDREWYELAIGVRATALLYHVLPQLADEDPDAIFDALRPALVQMDADISGLEELGADEGKVLRYIYDLGIDAWPKSRAEDQQPLLQLTRAQLTRTRALLEQVPASRHAYTLVLAASEFSADREQALAVLDLAPPAEHAEAVALRRAQAALDLVVSWDAREHAARMLELVDAIDGPDRPLATRRLVVDAHVVARRLGQPGELPRLEARYRELLATPGGERDVVLLNNLAALVAEQGRTREALELWKGAEAVAEDNVQRDMIALNVLGARIAAGVFGAAERERLAELEQSPAAVEVRLLARAWRVAASSGAEARK